MAKHPALAHTLAACECLRRLGARQAGAVLRRAAPNYHEIIPIIQVVRWCRELSECREREMISLANQAASRTGQKHIFDVLDFSFSTSASSLRGRGLSSTVSTGDSTGSQKSLNEFKIWPRAGNCVGVNLEWHQMCRDTTVPSISAREGEVKSRQPLLWQKISGCTGEWWVGFLGVERFVSCFVLGRL